MPLCFGSGSDTSNRKECFSTLPCYCVDLYYWSPSSEVMLSSTIPTSWSVLDSELFVLLCYRSEQPAIIQSGDRKSLIDACKAIYKQRPSSPDWFCICGPVYSTSILMLLAVTLKEEVFALGEESHTLQKPLLSLHWQLLCNGSRVCLAGFPCARGASGATLHRTARKTNGPQMQILNIKQVLHKWEEILFLFWGCGVAPTNVKYTHCEVFSSNITITNHEARWWRARVETNEKY